MALKSGCTFNAGKAIKEAPIKNLLKLSTSAHHLKSLVAGAFHSMLGTHLSLLKFATGSGNLINDMLNRVLSVPNGPANHLSASKFEKIMPDTLLNVLVFHPLALPIEHSPKESSVRYKSC